MAYKVARFKTALNGVGKKLDADLKDISKKIDAKRKRVRAPVGCVTGGSALAAERMAGLRGCMG
jgi:hypothetical protein